MGERLLLGVLACSIVVAPAVAIDRSETSLDTLFGRARELSGHGSTRRTIDRQYDAEAIAVRDRETGVGVRVERLAGQGDRGWITEDARGVEEWIGFERRPAREVLRARFAPENAAGVRVVSRTIELLDDDGVPRVRMAPPWLIDARGRRVEVAVAVEGCTFDDDVRAPFGRAPIASDGDCTLALSWEGRDVVYPIVVDPIWSATDSLATPRREMAIGVLDDGSVLVAGGITSAALDTFAATASAERFDPESETFAAAADMPTGRGHPWFVSLADGRLLVGGGAGSGSMPATVAGAVTFDGVTGAWTATMPPRVSRVWAEAALLDDGSVLVVAGKPDLYFGRSSLASAERYDPAANTWTDAGTLDEERYGNFVLARLPDGRVLAAGGWHSPGADLTRTSAEIYDPDTNDWTPTGSLTTSRSTGLFGVVGGRVVVGGGSTGAVSGTTNVASTEVFDPSMGTWTTRGDISAPVDYRTNGGLVWGDGSFVAPAGIGVRGLYSERYDPVAGTWENGCDPSRTYLVAVGAVRLRDGRALVVGGLDGTGLRTDAWLSGEEPAACDDGNPCTTDACGAEGCAFTERSGSCDDDDACTTSDTCSAGVCSGTLDPSCSDAGSVPLPDSGARDEDAGASDPDAAAVSLDAAAVGPDATTSVAPSSDGCACRVGARAGSKAPLALGALMVLAAWISSRRSSRR
ncbi:MAG: hypothetical protein J0L92_07115 [Deltaproteobacteria bacterium]|nr:hypothetical protein [Deltaproteobacteria bacterium]